MCASRVLHCRLQAPRITRQPQSTQLDEGQPFVLSVAAEGSLPLTHQWQYGGRRLRGETSAELRVQVNASDVRCYCLKHCGTRGTQYSNKRT